MATQKQTFWIGVIVAVGATIVACLGRFFLENLIGSNLPYLTFFAAVIVAAWIGGFWPGLIATLLSAIAAWYFFLPPEFSFQVIGLGEIVGLTIFTLVGGLTSGFCESLHRERRRLAIQNERLATEIVERQSAERTALTRSEELRTTLESIGDAVIVTDGSGRIVLMNQVAESLTGWRCGDARGQALTGVFRIINENTRTPSANPVQRVLAEGVVCGLANHTVLISRDGAEFPIDDSAAPIRDAEGRLSGCVLVFRDISERRRVESSRALLAAVVESSDDAIITKTQDGTITSWNRGAAQLFGYSADEAIGKSIKIIIPANRYREEDDILERLARGEKVDHFETERLDKQGRLHQISLTISPIRDEYGAFVGASKVARDISDRRLAETKLRRSEHRLRLIIDSLPVVITYIDKDLKYRFFNQTLCEWFNLNAEEVRGKTAEEILGPTAFQICRPWMEQALSGKSVHWEAEIPYLHGGMRPVEIRYIPDFAPDGTVEGYVGLIEDISERRKVERDLQDIARRKDEFLATLAHELRNPLAPIGHCLELIRSSPDASTTSGELLGIIERQYTHMVRLVDDLLDLSRISRGTLELRREPIKLADVIKHSVETVRPLAEQNMQRLIVTLPPQAIELNADPVRLAQVFANLLNNSCKFSPSNGTISLDAAIVGEAIRVVISDHGIGIPSDKLDTIFEMFTQIDPTTRQSNSGLGLGLTLVRKIVELHGGRVEVDSLGKGHGSRFTVYLPASVTTHAATVVLRPHLANRPLVNRRILVVDDYIDNAKCLSMLLAQQGGDVRMAHDGQQAYEMAESFSPDLIFLDIGLPKTNGYDVCRQIRKQSWGQKVLIIALTGWGQDNDRRQSMEAGFNAHLVKPLDHRSLLRTLDELSQDRSANKSTEVRDA